MWLIFWEARTVFILKRGSKSHLRLWKNISCCIVRPQHIRLLIRHTSQPYGLRSSRALSCCDIWVQQHWCCRMPRQLFYKLTHGCFQNSDLHSIGLLSCVSLRLFSEHAENISATRAAASVFVREHACIWTSLMSCLIAAKWHGLTCWASTSSCLRFVCAAFVTLHASLAYGVQYIFSFSLLIVA